MFKSSLCSYLHMGLIGLSLLPQARLASAEPSFCEAYADLMGESVPLLVGAAAIGGFLGLAHEYLENKSRLRHNKLCERMKSEEKPLLQAVESMLMSNAECLKSLSACAETLADEGLDHIKTEKGFVVVLSQGELHDALVAYCGFLKSVAPWCRDCAKSVTDQSELWMAFAVEENSAWKSRPWEATPSSDCSSCCCSETGSNWSFRLIPFFCRDFRHIGGYVAHSSFVCDKLMKETTILWNTSKAAKVVVAVHIIAVNSCYRVEIKISAEAR
jgi:hypothetical protein